MCAWSTPALCQEGETKCLFSWIFPGFFLTPLNIVLYCVSHKCRSSRVRRATVWCFRSGGALCWERNKKKKSCTATVLVFDPPAFLVLLKEKFKPKRKNWVIIYSQIWAKFHTHRDTFPELRGHNSAAAFCLTTEVDGDLFWNVKNAVFLSRSKFPEAPHLPTLI